MNFSVNSRYIVFSLVFLLAGLAVRLINAILPSLVLVRSQNRVEFSQLAAINSATVEHTARLVTTTATARRGHRTCGCWWLICYAGQTTQAQPGAHSGNKLARLEPWQVP